MMGTAFTEETLNETIAEIDEDGSGQIEFEEFTILAAKFIVEEDDEDVQKELKEAFRLYDKEGTNDHYQFYYLRAEMTKILG